MSPLLLIIIACITCSAICAFLYVADLEINKPVAQPASILSDAQVQALVDKFNSQTSTPVPYSNVLNYSIGHIGHVMPPLLPANSVTIKQCNTLCNGTTGCQGFQFGSITNQCELLSNISNTFYSYDNGWNIFTSGNPPNNGLAAELVGTGYSADPSKKKGPIIGVNSFDNCASYCYSNAATCKGFSINASGCTLFSDTTVSVVDPSTNSWTVVPVNHGNGLTSTSN